MSLLSTVLVIVVRQTAKGQSLSLKVSFTVPVPAKHLLVTGLCLAIVAISSKVILPVWEAKSICNKLVKVKKSPNSAEFFQNCLCNKHFSATINLMIVRFARLVCRAKFISFLHIFHLFIWIHCANYEVWLCEIKFEIFWIFLKKLNKI
jgi:hypothetical protein